LVINGNIAINPEQGKSTRSTVRAVDESGIYPKIRGDEQSHPCVGTANCFLLTSALTRSGLGSFLRHHAEFQPLYRRSERPILHTRCELKWD
jgi:hypothetical protein